MPPLYATAAGFIFILLASVGSVRADESSSAGSPSVLPAAGRALVVHVKVEGMIDGGLAAFVQRAVALAEQKHAEALLIEMNTYGGRVDAADDIRTMDPPSIRLDFSKRLQVIIHWGPNPHDERRNGRPQGTIGCEIQFHRGGIPAKLNSPDLPISLEHEVGWVTLDIDTESPFIHTVHEDEPTTYAYRACYISKDLKRGPFGNPTVCTVSV